MTLDRAARGRERHTKDKELFSWERGCWGFANMLERASWYGGSHAELWYRISTARQRLAKQADCVRVGDVKKAEGKTESFQPRQGDECYCRSVTGPGTVRQRVEGSRAPGD